MDRVQPTSDPLGSKKAITMVSNCRGTVGRSNDVCRHNMVTQNEQMTDGYKDIQYTAIMSFVGRKPTMNPAKRVDKRSNNIRFV